MFRLLDQTGSDVMVLALGRVQNKTFMSFKVVRIYVWLHLKKHWPRWLFSRERPTKRTTTILVKSLQNGPPPFNIEFLPYNFLLGNDSGVWYSHLQISVLFLLLTIKNYVLCSFSFVMEHNRWKSKYTSPNIMRWKCSTITKTLKAHVNRHSMRGVIANLIMQQVLMP